MDIRLKLVQITHALLQKAGRGGSFPGELALKMDPDFIQKFKMPKIFVLVTGTNGKTTTSNGLRYETYDRRGPKVFAGEYACHGKGKKWNHYETSLYEAAFMTDLERNADIVHMATYAPLFAHIEGWQWRPDMIWYDNTRMFKTTSYYVQQMYATHKGTHALRLTMNGKPVAGQDGQDGLFASAVADKAKHTIIVKVINTSNQSQPVSIRLQDRKSANDVHTLTLCHTEMDEENTLDNPDLIRPVAGKLDAKAVKGSVIIDDIIPAKSFRLYETAE